MSKRHNEKFVQSYMELDRMCCERFGTSFGGVTEYINRLNNTRFAPNREDVLPRLVRYRNLRNRMAHEVASIRRITEITKHDVAWVKKFAKDMLRKRDPLASYLKKARRYARMKMISRIVTATAAAILAIILIIVLAVVLK